ncbi:MAG: hypothetical protein HOA15_01625 [Candidatus Marinimicrobia bacterium]|jgi:pimeloyl-ACP methyl ester carboxylesterase|nr:hypothetical protein [Candidatus Neomarinimicrobiota bacterium]MBT3764140.1 hypothetical protein [Candidatus Neomarinimicrobiota bacterium]MBT4069607.1 hypothetical protein [Candidatus Neomarinimicrobiota bacterium]MBT4270624.1 hypothetical protein [Candidatus Neomarinimicrobiota bacterium]MBT4371376.1 hypothetical protein [Candidatus Neomarinimicrobiota bacterium]
MIKQYSRIIIRPFLLIILFSLFACEDKKEDSVCTDPIQGKFINVQEKGTISAEFINGLRPSFGIPETFVVKYDVAVLSVTYTTVNPDGKETTASGAVYIPKTGDDNPLSLLSGHHGTTIKKADVPSVLPLYGYLGLFGAGAGYAAVQADYLGLGSSELDYQPFSQKFSGVAVVDLIDGVRHYACENGIPLNDNVFMLGYSNGGYVSMAVHDELQVNPRSFNIDASVMVAGYFDLRISESFQIPDSLYRPSWALYSPIMYDKRYNLGLMEKIVKPPYLEKLSTLFNGQKDATEIDNALTLISKDLLTESFLTSFRTNPDFKNYRDSLVSNSLADVIPDSPVLFIHSKEDGAVPYSQSVNMHQYINSNGGNASLVLLETGQHNPVAYAPAVIQAIDWLKQYE